jgi:hypothetical protein
MKDSNLRVVARNVLRQRGYEVSVKPGQGYLPGARLMARRRNEEMEVAVKASKGRALSFNRQSEKRWRTLHAVDLVIAIVPSTEAEPGAEVFAFRREALVRAFNRAWKQLESAKRATMFNMPVFIPLDRGTPKNLGHHVDNLKSFAEWSMRLDQYDLEELSAEVDEYVEVFRRRYAEENGVEVAQVKISISRRRNE